MSALVGAAPSWTGTIPTWLILILGVLFAWRIARGGGGTAVTELSKANEVLEQRLNEERTRGADREQKIAELAAKTDVVLAVAPLIQAHERHAAEMLAAHERKAQERHDATIHVLEAIRDKLTT